MNHILSKWNSLKWHIKVGLNGLKDRLTPKNAKSVIFDPSIETKNLGDDIICFYGKNVLEQILQDEIILLPTQTEPTVTMIDALCKSRHKIVCGTNLITPDFEAYRGWKMPKYLRGYTDIITLAVGWSYYSKNMSKAAKHIYRHILSKKGLHSVRDRYTEQKFHEMGIHNVVFTGCVSLWSLTPEKCKMIPCEKNNHVVTTITDYYRDPQTDKRMLEILLENYETVYVWPQGMDDVAYLSTLVDIKKIHMLDRSVEAFTETLRKGNIDYVGTRLHGGIHALNQNVRSIIIGIDNRAIEMGKDVNLPVLRREEINAGLAKMIQSHFETDIILPWGNISRWKKQFE